MSAKSNVEYEKFIAIGGLDLCHYMEPLLGDCTTTVSEDVLCRMLSELPTYDEYHLVYALTLGIKHSPQTFAMQLPLYLSHEEASVWSTAFNSLDQLPGEYVTQALVDSVRKVHASCPAKPWIADILNRLEERLREKAART
jgi:hypothetical protein